MSRYYKNRDPLVDTDTPYEQDLAAQWFVNVYAPDGGTLDEIGIMLDVTRERVRQIEKDALKKAKEACLQEGINIRTVLRVWSQRNNTHPLAVSVVE